MGLITTNSFMKREFGKKIIEDFFPLVDLTHIIDTSGAYIPGHGTPTVILYGRNRKPVSTDIRAALGIRGEPSTPKDPKEGLVWRSIVDHLDDANWEGEFITIADVARKHFATHPWSIGGGGASELKTRIEKVSTYTLGAAGSDIGFLVITGEDNCLILPQDVPARYGLTDFRPLGDGEFVRDWSCSSDQVVLWPNSEDGERLETSEIESHLRFLWSYRTSLKNRKAFGVPVEEKGIPWWALRELYKDRLRTPFTIAFAFIATHNHFVLDRGQKVFNRSAPIIKLTESGGVIFKQSAPVIKLSDDATEEDHLVVLGLLNSSIACFWMKQVFYPKATSTGDISTEKGKPEANRYEFAGTGMEAFPIPGDVSDKSSTILRIATMLDRFSVQLSDSRPESVIQRWDGSGRSEDLENLLNEAETNHGKNHKRMIALQEELDWECYKAYGVSPEGSNEEIIEDDKHGITPDQRPFAWTNEDAPNGIPTDWLPIYQKRKELTSQSKELKLLEDIVFKRPWWGRQGVYGRLATDYAGWQKEALESWLLDRLESEEYFPHESDKPDLSSCAKLSDIAAGGFGVLAGGGVV